LSMTKNSTSIFFGCSHLCTKHATPITVEHIETCDLFVGYERLRELIDKLKRENIRDWDAKEQDQAIILFKLLAEQIQMMIQAGLAKHQQKKIAKTTSEGPKRPRGRPKKDKQSSPEGIRAYFKPKRNSHQTSIP